MPTNVDETGTKSSGLISLLAILAVPYVVIGVAWASNHTSHLTNLNSPDYFFSFAGEVLVWPLLTFSDITLE